MNEQLRLLLTLAPLLATLIPGNPTLAALISESTAIAEREVAFRMEQTGKTREEILADARRDWEEAGHAADALLALGHAPDSNT